MGKAGEKSGGLSPRRMTTSAPPARVAETDDEGGIAKVQGLTLERKANYPAMKGLCAAQSQFACAAGTAYMVKLRFGPDSGSEAEPKRQE